jgi:hypothetical protein
LWVTTGGRVGGREGVGEAAVVDGGTVEELAVVSGAFEVVWVAGFDFSSVKLSF